MNLRSDLLYGGTRRCLLSMTLPMLAAMALNMAYSLVDSLWIGNLLGETAYAALTNATPVILLFTSVAMGAANGVAILLSQAVGAGDRRETERLLATSLALALALSLGLTAALEAGLRPLLSLLRTPAETMELARDYLAVYLLGCVAVYLYCYFTAVLRSFGNTTFQVIAMVVCTALNAGLDPLLIRRFGFRGAAAATLLSQGLCLLFLLAYLWKKRLIALHWRAFDRRLLLPLLQKGVPSAVQQSIPAISTTFLTALVNGYGITALAAYGIAGKLETILFYPAMALNMVLTAIVGQCVGARRPDRGRDYLLCAVRGGAGCLLVLSALVICFAEPLAGLFLDSAAAAAVVADYVRIVGAGYVLNTVTNCCLGAVNGLGKPWKSLLCMALYYLVIRMPLAWLLSRFGPGLRGIWIAVLASHVVAALAAAAVARRELRRACPAL